MVGFGDESMAFVAKAVYSAMCETRSRSLQGFSLLELLIALAIILLIVAIAIPKFLAVHSAALAAAAASNLRSLDHSLIAYSTTYPEVGLPSTLAKLGGADPCTPSSATACLISDALAQSSTTPYEQYLFTYSVTAAGGVNVSDTVSADPVNGTVPRHFFLDNEGDIHYKDGGAASASDSLLGN